MTIITGRHEGSFCGSYIPNTTYCNISSRTRYSSAEIQLVIGATQTKARSGLRCRWRALCTIIVCMFLLLRNIDFCRSAAYRGQPPFFFWTPFFLEPSFGLRSIGHMCTGGSCVREKAYVYKRENQSGDARLDMHRGRAMPDPGMLDA